jgi:hypothetical protein
MATLPDKHKNYRNSIKNKYYLRITLKLRTLDVKKVLVISKKKLNNY